MNSQELREKFRDFFTKNTHKEVKSASLIPNSDDKTVLFITAGMQPFIPNLLGSPHPKGNRIFSIQKSFRTPDIDEVGDDTHHTFFEMLGNWSFGDYFKKEAIDMAYDFFVNYLKLDPKKLYITVFKGNNNISADEESKQIWLTKDGIEENQIYYFGEKDNFWGPAGKVGPCGPCSEIHYDRGEEYGEFLGPNSDENQRCVEIWNLVFMEYNKDENGNLEKLKQKNVDTGVGFERLLSVLQNKNSSYETDLFTDIINKIEKISNTKYENNKKSFRIIADHVKAATFCLADGVTVSNEGRGYILRRLIRRAFREAKKLNINMENVLSYIAEVVIKKYQDEYSELLENKSIKNLLDIEENNFKQTLKKGENMMQKILEEKKHINGKDAFLLFDTFGFPLDITKDLLKEKNISFNEENLQSEFKEEMKLQQERSRKGSGNNFKRENTVLYFNDLPKTEFLGYEKSEVKAKILNFKIEKNNILIALDKTCFYAESGGQVGDQGIIKINNQEIEIYDCKKISSGVFIHYGKLDNEIKLEKNQEVLTKINTHHRNQVARNHSLAHLFLSVAKKILQNDGITQAGSLINFNETRFDFTFDRNLYKEEIGAIEKELSRIVNQNIKSVVKYKSIEDAKKSGAIANFEEKYGDTVRTIKFGEYSYELCGGTHVKNTSEIGSVKIISEAGISAGVRRVKIICGVNSQKFLMEQNEKISQISEILKTPEIIERIKKIISEKKDLETKINFLNNQIASFEVDNIFNKVFILNNQKVILEEIKNSSMQLFVKKLLKKECDLVILINEKNIIIGCKNHLNAKDILNKINEKFGSKGGGNQEFARGGGLKIESIEEIKNFLNEII